MNLIAAFLSKLAIGVLNTLLARKDLKDSVRLDILVANERWAKEAEAYKAEHPVDLANLPPGLRLRKRSDRIKLQNKNTRNS